MMVMVVAVAAMFASTDHVSAQHDFSAKVTMGTILGSSIDNTRNAAGGSGSGKLRSDPGFLDAVAVGYGWGQWRTEVERVRTDQYVSGPVAALEAGADRSYVYNLATRSWFANLYRVFPMRGRLAPYAGLGVGLVQASIDYQVGRQVPKDRTDEALACLLTLFVACDWGADRGTFRDEVVGYRPCGGVVYTMGRFAVELKLGWIGLIGLDGQDQARNEAWYGVTTDHLSSKFMSIGMSYQFWRRG